MKKIKKFSRFVRLPREILLGLAENAEDAEKKKVEKNKKKFALCAPSVRDFTIGLAENAEDAEKKKVEKNKKISALCAPSARDLKDFIMITGIKQVKGKVILAAAGPGDPELITIKTAQYLAQADVVLTDRLVSEEILNEYVKPDAEIVYVGKQCRKGVSTPQATINDLIVQYTLEGKLVVRLKGGDVSIFSNIMDELGTVVSNNIPYEIIPGVTAALGASAYAGIPLTARGYSTAVRLLTYYKSDVVPNEYWKELAETDDTLVFYMSSETLDKLVEKLVENNIEPDKLLAVIEQATTPMQNVHITSLYEYEEQFKGKSFISPSLVIIGKVVALHRQFAWLKNSNSSEYYFKPVSNQLTTIENSNKVTLNATRV